MTHPGTIPITADRRRYDTVDAPGFPHMLTPNSDRLVTEGVRYAPCFCVGNPPPHTINSGNMHARSVATPCGFAPYTERGAALPMPDLHLMTTNRTDDRQRAYAFGQPWRALYDLRNDPLERRTLWAGPACADIRATRTQPIAVWRGQLALKTRKGDD